ncbi:hypothetical protein AURDEDRAFT_175416 [Auricularia subglabra TFB-10046 SS5]|uniref:Mid2 domain-containing protein n=1 Tax=Auricularia subglabra (strain TFB-10046 / SS5) TaxID=717982 RepID=J0WTB7_AURST|nr:hypothetical protein AURDEDRAFT_175416 [Auricularia subglabra TFB-10046 SS5]
MRLRLSATGSLLLSLVSFSSAAATCSQHVKTAVQVVEGDGIGVACCLQNSNNCTASIIGACEGKDDQWAFCVGADGAHACAISYGTDPGAPCGAYTGPTGATFGMTPVATGYAVPLQNADIEGSLRRNWGRLSTLSDAGLCCSAADVSGAAPCHVGKVPTLEENHCNAGEYEIKCFGTPTHGLCTVFSNETVTTEIGQYYLVNFDADAPKPSATSSSTTTGGTPTPLSGETDAGSHKSGVNAVAIAVPIAIVVLLLLILAAAFIVWRRRRRAGVKDVAPYDSAFTAQGVGASPIAARRVSSATGRTSSVPYVSTAGQTASYHSSHASPPRGGKYLHRAVDPVSDPEAQPPTYSMHSDDQGQVLRS